MSELPTVLVVDDQASNREALRSLLASEGVIVVTCASGAEALTYAASAVPDLVLLDVMMPGIDGFETCRRLRAEAKLAEVPVLLVTALDDRESRLAGFEAGADDFITKPYDRIELRTRIRGLLRLNRFRRLLEQRARAEKQQAALVQAEKLAAMGSLLAGVAHELNNPLAIITGSADLLLQQPLSDRDKRRVQTILTAGEQCARIVRNFLALARRRAPERSVVQMNRVVDEALEMLGHQLRVNGIQVTRNLDPALPETWADGHRLHQVVVNLVTNAEQAMRSIAQGRALALTTRHADGQIVLEVADSGPGIAPDVQERVFEPFFTTKPAGEGTGLGLALCQSVAVEHGGSISVESAPGQGATFRLTLPVTAPESAAPAAPAPAVTRKLRILVVDDDEPFARVLAESLRVDGHSVETAIGGAAALARLEHGHPDLIMSDVVMAGLDGAGLYDEAVRRWPALKSRFAFVTGDTLHAETRTFLERVRLPVLEKPFTVESVRSVLAQAASALWDAEKRG